MVASTAVVLDSLITDVKATRSRLVTATPAIAVKSGRMPTITEPKPRSSTRKAMMMPTTSVSVFELAWATWPPKFTVIPAALAGPPELSNAVCEWEVTLATATG